MSRWSGFPHFFIPHMAKGATSQSSKDGLLQEIMDMAQKVKTQLPTFDVPLFIQAFEFARSAHEGQLRKDGSPYIIHPVATTQILSQLRVDEDTLIAALLHDVPEDTPRTVAEIEEAFGGRVAFLVEGITKLSKVHYQHDMESRSVESLKKLLIHTAKDPRVILIKLADRLHNMRTLHFVDKEEKRRRVSRETLEIYIPMASLLGIQGIKSELEDLCFKYLYPAEFEEFSQAIAGSDARLHDRTDETIQRVSTVLHDHAISSDVFPRRKTLFSIFRKVQAEQKTVRDLHDLITLRVLVPTVEDAYRALGIIHTMFKPRPGSFKDYISVPKINGYRSLHTTIFGIDGTLTEFQIRTYEMDNEAEYGMTTYYFLQSHQKKDKQEDDWRAKWMSEILALEQQEGSSRNFVENVKADIFEDKIFIFTPKGTAIHLPKQSSVIDFAYAIHTDIGNHAVRADINGYSKPLYTILKSGDTVSVDSDPEGGGPQRDWLTFAKTSLAKNRIREFLNKETSRKKLLVGKQLLQKAFYRAGIGLVDDVPFKKIQAALIKHHYPEYEDLRHLLIALGEGTLDASDVIQSLYPNQKLSDISRVNRRISKLIETLYYPSQRERISLRLVVIDRPGLIAQVVTILSQFFVNLIDVSGHGRRWYSDHGHINVTFDLDRYDTLQSIFSELEKIEGVFSVSRIFRAQEIVFALFLCFTITFWFGHPFVIDQLNQTSNTFLVYIGLMLLFIMGFSLSRFMPRYVSRFQEGRSMILATGSITILALVTLLWEIAYYKIALNVATVSIIVAVVSYLGFQFWDYKRKKLF